MASRDLILLPEQMALSKVRKQRKNQTQHPVIDLQKGRILSRTWVTLQEPSDARQRVKVQTWNLLAQCLVRRELFPTSDCLKAHQREHMLFNEITSYKADILCLQEVDRLEKLLPVLEHAGYAHIYAAGPRKLHGCLIAYRKDKYSLSNKHVVYYDDQNVREGAEGSMNRGSSFRTKNIASLLALNHIEQDNTGLIVATSHLFWHPKYTYERSRQALLLLRETTKFRDRINHDWPCIIAGDFNFAPNDPAYSLLVGDPVLPSQEELLTQSHVVHKSIDPEQLVTTISGTTQVSQDEDESSEQDPDRVITHARPATPQDGLLSTAELSHMAALYGPLKSCYDEGQKQCKASHPIPTFSDRVPVETNRRGGFEPEWTSYTHYWKTVLDYIFVLDPPSQKSRVTGFLNPHTTKHLEPGLPKKSVCGSDHVSLVCEISW